MCFDYRPQLLLGICNKEIIKYAKSIHPIMEIFKNLTAPNYSIVLSFCDIEAYQLECNNTY